MSTIKHKHFANDTIYTYLDPGDVKLIECEVAEAFEDVLKALVINTDDDHNTKDTAHRVAKMFVHEIFRGRYYPPPEVTAFPNVKQYDQLYMSGPMSINSTCAHHFQPIKGKAYVGIFPGDKVVGLSKFNRIVDWVASRPQIQEEMTEQIADMIEKETDAKGVAVVIKAEHFCMTARGVKEHESEMVTSVLRGVIRNDDTLRQELFSLLNNMKGMN
jgi:GTP cyclohydrolase I